MAHPRRLRDHETLEQLIDRLPAAVYVSNARGDILDANPACLRLFGVRSLDELQRFRVEELVVDPSRREHELSLLDDTGAMPQYELEVRRPDGQMRTVVDTCYVERDAETGEPIYHGILFDVSDRKRLEARLREQSIRDPLTGCFNRRYLGEIEERMQEESVEWGVLVVDIDGFKETNDRLGHQAGDRVLVELVRYLTRLTRPEDAVVRLGGDEFCVLVQRDAQQVLPAIAARLQTRASGGPPVALSAGWAVREEGETLERTLARADRRLLDLRVASRAACRRGEAPPAEPRL